MEQISQRDDSVRNGIDQSKDTVNHGTDQSKGLMLLTVILTDKNKCWSNIRTDRIKQGSARVSTSHSILKELFKRQRKSQKE